jgi:hypothetical protein
MCDFLTLGQLFRTFIEKVIKKILGAKGVLLCLNGNAGSPCRGIKISQSHKATKKISVIFILSKAINKSGHA